MWDDFVLFVAVGFAAQLVDGTIGMAYGLTSTSVLLSFGITPAAASASVHAAEVFTTGVSGLSHWRFGNIRWSLLWRLALPGMVGGALGAFLLSSIRGETVLPFISLYLLGMGAWILWKALHGIQVRQPHPPPSRWLGALGFGGGFLDAIGGGGWGPMVTSTLVGQGNSPRFVIGSVNGAEFFVTLTISGTFLTTIGLELWPIIAGLILGGVLAAPLAAYTAQKLPDRPLMVLVGAGIILLSIRGLIRAFS